VALLLGHPSWKGFAIGSSLGVASCLLVSAMVTPDIWWLGEGALLYLPDYQRPTMLRNRLVSHERRTTGMSITVTGTIQRSDMGAGTWAVVTDDGVTYEVHKGAPRSYLNQDRKSKLKDRCEKMS